MNLLWLESAIATQAMSAWVIRESKSNDRLYNDALETLGNLHILPKSPIKLALNATFKSSFRQAITGGYVVFLSCWMKALANLLKRGTSGSFGVPSEKEDKKHSVDLETLDNFALEKWEVRILVESTLFIFFPICDGRLFCTIWYLRQNQVNNQEGPLTVFCSSYNEVA